MASSHNASPAPKVLLSKLPALFTHGIPTSLEKMTLNELQTFIPFMLNCSLGYEVSSWTDIPRPVWWPEGLPFSMTMLKQSEPAENWRQILMDVIQRCYAHNKSEYLLYFCKQLVEDCSEGFIFRENKDGTTSLLDSVSGKLLVSVRNENLEYDSRVSQQMSASPRRTLLPQQPPTIQSLQCDIYLCDNCDEEFTSLRAIKDHERMCGPPQGDEFTIPHSPSSDVSDREEIENVDQGLFLSFFSLQPTDGSGPPKGSPLKPSGVMKRSFGSSYNRYISIEVTSPLGQLITETSRLGKQPFPAQCVERYERYFTARSYRSKPGPACSKWAVTYTRRKGPSTTGTAITIEDTYIHTYCFTRAQKFERMKTLDTGLNKRSRILKKKCKRCSVALASLTEKEVRSWTPTSTVQASPDLSEHLPELLPLADDGSSEVLEEEEEEAPSVNKEPNLPEDILVINLSSDDEDFNLTGPFEGKPSGENLCASAASPSPCPDNDSEVFRGPKNGGSHWPHKQVDGIVAVNGRMILGGSLKKNGVEVRKVLGPLDVSETMMKRKRNEVEKMIDCSECENSNFSRCSGLRSPFNRVDEQEDVFNSSCNALAPVKGFPSKVPARLHTDRVVLQMMGQPFQEDASASKRIPWNFLQKERESGELLKKYMKKAKSRDREEDFIAASLPTCTKLHLEVQKLIGDECKELKAKGLDSLLDRGRSLRRSEMS